MSRRTATLALAVMVRVAAAGLPSVVTDEGENAHDKPEASPVHPNDIVSLDLLTGMISTVVLADCPLASDSELGLSAILKPGERV